MSTWSLMRLAAQVVVVPVDEGAVSTITAQAAAGAGGVILYGTWAPPDLATALSRLARAEPGDIAPLIMTDEEGGSVQRMSNVVGSMPSARQMAATMTPPQIQELALHAARAMRASGVTVDLAPVLDLDAAPGPNPTDPIGTRSFSADVGTASADALAFAAGLRAGGVIPVVKHFPGLGGATGNTDLQAATTLPWKQLESSGLLPYRTAVSAGTPAVMVSNAVVPGLSTLPASISPEVIGGQLRSRLGFQRLVITDSLSAGAISTAGYTVPRAAVAALRAGADLVLYNATPSTVARLTADTISAIAAATRSGALPLGRLRDAAVHILTAKNIDLCK